LVLLTYTKDNRASEAVPVYDVTVVTRRSLVVSDLVVIVLSDLIVCIVIMCNLHHSCFTVHTKLLFKAGSINLFFINFIRLGILTSTG